MDIPIIIFHLGYKEYVYLSLLQALKYNKKVILITDCVNMYKKHNNLTIINYNNFCKNTNNFKNKYIHFSKNSLQIELICIIRWMVIYEYMSLNNINKAFICDSDILIYDNITNINNKYFDNKDFMLCSSPTKNLSGCSSLMTIDKLKDFVEFIFTFYNENVNKMKAWYNSYKEPGGVCDMTLLYYFAHNENTFQGLRLPNYPSYDNDLTQIFDNELTFDLHLDAHGNHIYPSEWEVNKEKSKNIKYINNQPYCLNNRLNKDIRFILLHFQGRNKKIMKDFYLRTNKN